MGRPTQAKNLKKLARTKAIHKRKMVMRQRGMVMLPEREAARRNQAMKQQLKMSKLAPQNYLPAIFSS